MPQLDTTIENLDLEPIKFKLVMEKGWTEEEANEIERQYKGYLHLSKKYPMAPLVPSEQIDEMWHTHILDTHKYMEDCDAVFGYYLHHFPYFGIRGPEDAENLDTTFQATKRLFKNELGISVGGKADASTCESSKCGSCSGGDSGHCLRKSSEFGENEKDVIASVPALVEAGFTPHGIRHERPRLLTP